MQNNLTVKIGRQTYIRKPIAEECKDANCGKTFIGADEKIYCQVYLDPQQRWQKDNGNYWLKCNFHQKVALESMQKLKEKDLKNKPSTKRQRKAARQSQKQQAQKQQSQKPTAQKKK